MIETDILNAVMDHLNASGFEAVPRCGMPMTDENIDEVIVDANHSEDVYIDYLDGYVTVTSGELFSPHLEVDVSDPDMFDLIVAKVLQSGGRHAPSGVKRSRRSGD